MSAQDDPIRLKILRELRSLQIRKSEDPNLERNVINIGSMANGSGYEAGVIYRICTELEEEGLIRWTRKKTMGGNRAQLKRSFDITLEGRRFLDSIVEGEPAGSARGTDRAVGFPGAYDAAYDPTYNSAGRDSNDNELGTETIKKIRVDAVSNSVRISCETLLLSVEEFSERIRVSNSLAIENPQAHKEVIKFLADLKEQIDQLIELLPEDKESSTDGTAEKLSDWHTNVGIQVHHRMQSYFTPEYIGDNASPLILVGIFTSVCAALSGALGLPPTTGAVVGGVTAATYVGKGKSVVKEMDS